MKYFSCTRESKERGEEEWVYHKPVAAVHDWEL